MRRAAAAKALIVGPDMLLRLERRGLIHPLRDLNGHRRYTDEDLARLRQIIYPERADRAVSATT